MLAELREVTERHCLAADSPIECQADGTWFVLTRTGTCYVCEKHRRLVEVKLEREGLEPRMTRLPVAAA